jgi:hypothetical protein
MILQMVWLEENGGGSVSSLASTVISYRISGNMTGTDKDRTEIDSWLLISFCYAKGIALHLFLINYGKVEQNVWPSG